MILVNEDSIMIVFIQIRNYYTLIYILPNKNYFPLKTTSKFASIEWLCSDSLQEQKHYQ
jgi:hypothetical protein